MNQKLIVIDGKTYKGVDEMPEDVRRNYENAMQNFDKEQNGTPDMLENMNPFADKNNNGVPDVFEGLASLQGATANVMGTTKIVVNGQTYDSLEQLPPEIRAKYERAMGAMDANKNGIPDFVEGMFGVQSQTKNIATSFGAASPRPASSQPIPVTSTIEPESSGSWMLVVAGIVLAGLCLIIAAVGVWYFYFR